MKVEIKKLPKSQVELTVTVPHEVYMESEKAALEALGKEIKVDGFRSGNIPESVIREKIGHDAIYAQALEHLLPLTYAKAVKENDIQAIAPPTVDIKQDIKKEGDELVYVAVVSVMPEVKVGKYQKIKVARPKVKVEKKQADETLQMIFDRFAEWKNADRKAKKDDRTEITFEGFDEEGSPIPNTASKNHPVILGSNTMIPGFEDEVIGMSVGEKKECYITFPKDYREESMKGKKMKFNITLEKLEEKIAQELNEAFVEKATGQKQSVEDFKKKIEDDLLEEMKARSNTEHTNKVIDEIIKITQTDLPDVLIDEEIKYLIEEQKMRLKQQGITWEQFLQHIKKTEEDFKKDHREIAGKRLLARLGIQTIMAEEKITATDEEAQSKVDEIISRYPEAQKKQAQDYYKKDSEAYRQMKHSIAVDKLIGMLSK